MCLSKAYVISEKGKGLLMEDIARLEIRDNKLLMRDLFGEQKEIEANIKEIDFLNHTIAVENLRD
jgi:predicted RNA-binding protein